MRSPSPCSSEGGGGGGATTVMTVSNGEYRLQPPIPAIAFTSSVGLKPGLTTQDGSAVKWKADDTTLQAVAALVDFNCRSHEPRTLSSEHCCCRPSSSSYRRCSHSSATPPGSGPGMSLDDTRPPRAILGRTPPGAQDDRETGTRALALLRTARPLREQPRLRPRTKGEGREERERNGLVNGRGCTTARHPLGRCGCSSSPSSHLNSPPIVPTSGTRHPSTTRLVFFLIPVLLS